MDGTTFVIKCCSVVWIKYMVLMYSRMPNLWRKQHCWTRALSPSQCFTRCFLNRSNQNEWTIGSKWQWALCFDQILCAGCRCCWLCLQQLPVLYWSDLSNSFPSNLPHALAVYDCEFLPLCWYETCNTDTTSINAWSSALLQVQRAAVGSWSMCCGPWFWVYNCNRGIVQSMNVCVYAEW